MTPSSIRFAFFGSSRFSVIVLDALAARGFSPSCIVTTPDKPKGRSLALTPTPVKVWGQAHNIKAYDPAKLDDAFAAELRAENCDVFVVASYGKIIPQRILDIPPRLTLNIHPSLLPKYRGAAPLQSAMLDDAKDTGVTVMRINEKMDEGPIVAQRPVDVRALPPEIAQGDWPAYDAFEEVMAKEGAKLLASVLPDWVAGKIAEREQDHAAATYTRKIEKADGLLELAPDADLYLAFRKIQAYRTWPGAYFMIEKNGRALRVKVTDASFAQGSLHIRKVIPEGRSEMSYDDFLRGYAQPE